MKIQGEILHPSVEVRCTTLDYKEMFGLFATEDIKENSYIATYPGNVIDYKAFENMIKNYALINSCDFNVASDTLGSYAVDFLNNKVIIPTDSEGNIISEFKYALALRVNEPPPGKESHLRWVINYDQHKVELWTHSSAKKEDEVFICYGQGYRKSYPINETHCFCQRTLIDKIYGHIYNGKLYKGFKPLLSSFEAVNKV
jgi:hypothetical protein